MVSLTHQGLSDKLNDSFTAILGINTLFTLYTWPRGKVIGLSVAQAVCHH